MGEATTQPQQHATIQNKIIFIDHNFERVQNLKEKLKYIAKSKKIKKNSLEIKKKEKYQLRRSHICVYIHMSVCVCVFV